MPGLADAIEDIALDQTASDWRSAIRLAGDGLVRAGIATDAYTDEMIAAVEQHGPYVVIAPGLALAHARPSPAVLRAGLSWVQLREPVMFGAANDPVRLVIGLAATDHDSHLGIMSALAGALSNPDDLAALQTASTIETLHERLDAIENGAP